MDAYVYNADIFCAACAQEIMAETPKPAGMDPADEHTWDSDDYPKGPYADGGGLADYPQHCGSCGAFLQNALTSDGDDYVLSHIADDPERENAVIQQWREFYDHLEA
jgi:hypothetical protein